MKLAEWKCLLKLTAKSPNNHCNIHTTVISTSVCISFPFVKSMNIHSMNYIGEKNLKHVCKIHIDSLI